MKDINQQWVDSLKYKPLYTQVIELCKVLNGDFDVKSLRPFLIQFSDLLKDIQVANKVIGSNFQIGLSKANSNMDDFMQSRVDEVMRMRAVLRDKKLKELGIYD